MNFLIQFVQIKKARAKINSRKSQPAHEKIRFLLRFRLVKKIDCSRKKRKRFVARVLHRHIIMPWGPDELTITAKICGDGDEKNEHVFYPSISTAVKSGRGWIEAGTTDCGKTERGSSRTNN